MPAPATTDELVDLLYRSELFESPKLDSLLGSLKQSQYWTPDPKELASHLVASGFLTFFQATQLMKGRYRGFTLGKYKVLESIGSGGMANVYLCEHHTIRQRVAVKVVPIEKLRQGSMLGRFQREARAIAALQHPNIVRAYDLEADNQYHYLVMEFIDGVNLQRLVKRRGPLTTPRAVNYMVQAAEGLQYLLENNIVHRDIKPSNLMLDRRGCIKILDFGLTRVTDDENDNLTQQFDANRVLGTVDYLAPEQALKTHDVDIRADIYGLGVTSYFMLTGATPYQVVGMQNWSDAEKLLHQQSTEPKPLTYHRRDLPPGLVHVIQRMMSKMPEDRYQTPAQLIQALQPWYREVPPPHEEEIPALSLAAQTPPSQPSSSGWTRPKSTANVVLPPVRPAPPPPREPHRTPKLGELRVQTHWPPDTPNNASVVTQSDHPVQAYPRDDLEVVVHETPTEKTALPMPLIILVLAGVALGLGALATAAVYFFFLR